MLKSNSPVPCLNQVLQKAPRQLGLPVDLFHQSQKPTLGFSRVALTQALHVSQPLPAHGVDRVIVLKKTHISLGLFFLVRAPCEHAPEATNNVRDRRIRHWLRSACKVLICAVGVDVLDLLR